MSSFKSTNAGVPQGSVLGPMLFLVYVNDISESLLSLTRLFADDSSLFYSASNIQDIEGIINYDLHDLGMTLSNNGQWHSHIDNILTSAAKIVSIMRKLKFTFTRITLNQIYFSYVLPVLEYSSVVWDGCSLQDSNALDKLQNEAARIVTGLTRSVSLENLYRECIWISLAERRKQQKLTFMFKTMNGFVPSYISDLIPPMIREVTNYPLRNQNNITTPFCRTEILRKSCIPSSISLWNSLDESMRNSPSLNSFKYRLKGNSPNLRKIPPYYFYGDRYLSIMHCRIRNNCSNLSNDLYHNHLKPRPLCNCNLEIENTEHFFFRCPKYVNERVKLFHETRDFHPLNINLILFGDGNISLESNTTIFRSVQNYIKHTRRFDS